MPGSQLAGLRFFHVIAKLIFSVSHRRAVIPANRASPVNRASPPHVIGLKVLKEIVMKLRMSRQVPDLFYFILISRFFVRSRQIPFQDHIQENSIHLLGYI